ncbi:MAG: hypothetical protein MUP81_03985, partial [Dehalococcoidia bacterium]|nr:hypothetical protein [Dehalococcoidia bacterium]
SDEEYFISLNTRIKDISIIKPRLIYLAKILEGISEDPILWNYGETPIPSKLPQLIFTLFKVVGSEVAEAIKQEREIPFHQDQFKIIHEAVIIAIERVRKNILEI